MIEVRKSRERGVNDWGWLYSLNTFSVGSYYDPEQMGFSALRVINDDTVAPGKGFGAHSHKDMEIISLVLEGVIEHQDSQGNIKSLSVGEYQLMSAGKGISHSEYNALSTSPLRFMQVWIEPSELGGSPSYQQRAFEQTSGLTPIVTSTGEGGTLKIKQDVTMYQLLLNSGERVDLPIGSHRSVYLHLMSGDLALNSVVLSPGDGAKIIHEGRLSIANHGTGQAAALVFDLP